MFSPFFIGTYQEIRKTFGITLGNQPLKLFEPPLKGSVLFSMTVSNGGAQDVILDVGYSDLELDLVARVTPGADPLKDPWAISEFEKDLETTNLKVGDLLTVSGPLSGELQNAKKLLLQQDKDEVKVMKLEKTQNKGDFKIQGIKPHELLLEPCGTIVLEERSLVGISRFLPLGRLTVSKRAGFEGNPSLSGLDPQKLARVQKDKWPLLLKRPLYVKSSDQRSGPLHVHLVAGDF